MAQKKRLSPNQKAELKTDLAGLKTITSYKPVKDEFKTSEVEMVDAQLDSLDEQISQAEAHLSDLRNQAADVGITYVKKMKGARQQVVAQYGDDSPEYEAVGGTRTSNRRRPVRRSQNGSNSTPNG
jgi:hypothetical protein